MSESQISEQVSINAEWPVTAGRDARPVNQYAIVHGPGVQQGGPEGSVYLLLGHFVPPILASPQALEAYLEDDVEKTVDIRAEVYMTYARAEEFWRALGAHLGKAPQELD